MAVGVVVVAERVQPAHHRVEGAVDREAADVSHQVVDRAVSGPGVRTGLLDVVRREVDARHPHPGRGQAAGDPAVPAGCVEDPGPEWKVQQPQDLGSVGVRVLVVDRLCVEVRVVVAEGGLHVERHAPSSPPRVPCVRESHDLSFDAATAVVPTEDPHLFETTIHELWTVGDKPNGGYLLALLGRAALAAGRSDASRGWEVVSSSITYLRPPDLGPATVRTTLLRNGRSAAHVRAVLVQEGTELVDAVFVLGEVPAKATARYDAIEPLRAPEPEQCVRLPPRMPGGVHVGIMEVLDLRLDPATLPLRRAASSRGCPGRAARLDQVRGRAGSRSALAALRGRRDTAGHLPDRFDRLGAHAADVRLRPHVSGAGLARDPHDGEPGGRRHGRRDVHPVGQPRPRRGAVDTAGPCCASPTTSPDPRPGAAHASRGLIPVLVAVLLVVGVVAVPRAVPRDPRRLGVEAAAAAQLRRHGGARFRTGAVVHGPFRFGPARRRVCDHS